MDTKYKVYFHLYKYREGVFSSFFYNFFIFIIFLPFFFYFLFSLFWLLICLVDRLWRKIYNISMVRDPAESRFHWAVSRPVGQASLFAVATKVFAKHNGDRVDQWRSSRSVEEMVTMIRSSTNRSFHDRTLRTWDGKGLKDSREEKFLAAYLSEKVRCGILVGLICTVFSWRLSSLRDAI